VGRQAARRAAPVMRNVVLPALTREAEQYAMRRIEDYLAEWSGWNAAVDRARRTGHPTFFDSIRINGHELDVYVTHDRRVMVADRSARTSFTFSPDLSRVGVVHLERGRRDGARGRARVAHGFDVDLRNRRANYVYAEAGRDGYRAARVGGGGTSRNNASLEAEYLTMGPDGRLYSVGAHGQSRGGRVSGGGEYTELDPRLRGRRQSFSVGGRNGPSYGNEYVDYSRNVRVAEAVHPSDRPRRSRSTYR
jgi:hypothetical protein